MSHYKPYPAYKDSGVEWLGRVPEHWDVKSIKYVAPHVGSGKTPSGGSEVYQNSGILFLRSQNVYDDGLRLDDATYISEEIDLTMKGSRVRANDVLLNITGASIGRSCLVPEPFQPANVNQHVCIIRPESREEAKWLSLCLKSESVQSQIDFSQNGAGREGLNFEQIGNICISLPPTTERLRISEHLAHEGARIDGLIAKKTRFIELLGEKRQALITHAVTRGLDPTAKTKDSGIEWLGDVPAHWQVAPLKYVVSFRSGGTPSKENLEFWDGDIPWASAKDMKKEKLDDTQDHLTQLAFESGAASLVPAGSILVVVRGMILARIFPVVETTTPMAINQDLKALQPSGRLKSGFLAHLLRGLAGESLRRLEEAGHGTKALRMEAWTSMQLSIPGLEEQQKILDYLEEKISHLDNLITKTQLSLTLLKERRSALITAAVAGKIDLREVS